MTNYTYTAYGLHFASSFPLPELRPARNDAPDITISYGEVPACLPLPSANGVAWQAGPGRMLLDVAEIARYLLVENREVRIQPLPGVAEKDVRIFLLGSVLGALLHARQMLVLHASVIQTERGAVLFLGRTGAGKSTLLGALLQRGYNMLADDKAVIALNEAGLPQALPGFPLLRLTAEAVKELQYPTQGAELRHSLEKYVLPVTQFCAAPLPLHAAYALSAHNQTDIRLEPLPLLERFQVLNRHTYRRRFMHNAEQRQAHFRLLSAAANQARVTNVRRPDYPCLLAELAARIEEDWAR
jgi:hypothetical protein